MSFPRQPARAADADNSVDCHLCEAVNEQETHTDNLVFDSLRRSASRWTRCRCTQQQVQEHFTLTRTHTLSHPEQTRLWLAPHECPACRSRGITRIGKARRYQRELEVERCCDDCRKAWLETYALSATTPC